MSIWPREILTPEHTLFAPGLGRAVRSPEEYLVLQREVIAHNRICLPRLAWRDPWVASSRPVAVINMGRWLLHCPCGNAPLVHPGWLLACCLECGAIYREFVLPDDAQAIAAVLCGRPEIHQRNWAPPETVEMLKAENVAHGDPI